MLGVFSAVIQIHKDLLNIVPGPRGISRKVLADESYGRFPKFHRVFVGSRPWHIEIRHRVKKTSTINLFGFETLKLKIRRLKLWKPTVAGNYLRREIGRRPTWP